MDGAELLGGGVPWGVFVILGSARFDAYAQGILN